MGNNIKYCCKKQLSSSYMAIPKKERDENPIQIFQMSDTNMMLPQGDFKKFENADLILDFLLLSQSLWPLID